MFKIINSRSRFNTRNVTQDYWLLVEYAFLHIPEIYNKVQFLILLAERKNYLQFSKNANFKLKKMN
jgi:hypothetical protein